MGALFSKKNKEVFSTPLGLNNPVTVQVLVSALPWPLPPSWNRLS